MDWLEGVRSVGNLGVRIGGSVSEGVGAPKEGLSNIDTATSTMQRNQSLALCVLVCLHIPTQAFTYIHAAHQ